jgi:uncharacterized protein (UPF0276 family)
MLATMSGRELGSAALSRDAVGIGLRPAFYRELFERQPALDYLEIISDNFIDGAALPLRNLDRAAASYPIVLHGVGLNLLGHAPLDEGYLDAIARLADRVDAPFVTDHLCWTGAHGVQHHDLLPAPYTEDLVDYAASRARYVQERIGRPFGLENLSTYVELRASTMPEHELYTRVVREAGCWFMLDINNVYVSSQNHGFDALEYLRAIDYGRVLQAHIAGHTRQEDGTIVDTHDRPICDDVWQLYRAAWRIGGPFPTLIEWDAAIPPLAELLAHVEHARQVRA